MKRPINNNSDNVTVLFWSVNYSKGVEGNYICVANDLVNLRQVNYFTICDVVGNPCDNAFICSLIARGVLVFHPVSFIKGP